MTQERIEKAVRRAEGIVSCAHLDIEGCCPRCAVVYGLSALAADGPVAVLPGGEVVGMRELDEKIWWLAKAEGIPLYRLVADEGDGGE